MIAAAIVVGSPGGGGIGPSAPNASFLLPVVTAYVGNTVPFIDTSSGGPTSWAWTVNGASFSNGQNPGYYCAHQGLFNVQLTASNSIGSSTAPVQTFQVLPNGGQQP